MIENMKLHSTPQKRSETKEPVRKVYLYSAVTKDYVLATYNKRTKLLLKFNQLKFFRNLYCISRNPLRLKLIITSTAWREPYTRLKDIIRPRGYVLSPQFLSFHTRFLFFLFVYLRRRV